MLICVDCRCELVCDKNGVGADFGNGHVFASDRWKCPRCGHRVLLTNKTASFDPDHKFQQEYLNMVKEEDFSI